MTLPAHWTNIPLADAAAVVRGVTYDKREARSDPAFGFAPIIRATNIERSLNLSSELVYVPVSRIKPDQQLRLGDVVVATSSGSASVVGKSAQLKVEWEGGFGAFCSVLRAKSNVAPAYLAHFVASPEVRRRWSSAALGTNINNLKASDIRDTLMPLPPLPEQQRIVAAIEEAYSRLDAGESATKAAIAALMPWRQSVLSEAYELACTQGTAELGDLAAQAALFCDGDWVESKDQDPHGPYRLTQLADVGDGFWRDRSDRWMNEEQYQRLGCTSLVPNDVLVARMPDPLGRACLFPGDRHPCATVVDVAILRPGPNGPHPAWLMWMLNSPQARRQVDALAKGTTRRRISRRNLATVKLPTLDRLNQAAVASYLGEAVQLIERMRDALEGAQGQAEILRSAILAAAFAGRLTGEQTTADAA